MKTDLDICEETITNLLQALRDAHETTKKALEQRDELAEALRAILDYTEWEEVTFCINRALSKLENK